jgi:hypothetical protein
LGALAAALDCAAMKILPRFLQKTSGIRRFPIAVCPESPPRKLGRIRNAEIGKTR